MKQPREADTQKAIIAYLKSRGMMVSRMNAGDKYIPYKSKGGKSQFFKIVGHTPGMADIQAIGSKNHWFEPGILMNFPDVYWIEVKSATGKQSDLQKAFQKDVERRGHTYILARSLDDVMSVIK